MLPYIGYWMQSVELIVQAENAILQRRGLIAHNYCRAPALHAVEHATIDRFLEAFAVYLTLYIPP